MVLFKPIIQIATHPTSHLTAGGYRRQRFNALAADAATPIP
jgi:hypothetical protein